MTEEDRLAPIKARVASAQGDPSLWVGVGKGWYDLVLELDRKLAEIDPDYGVVQVKEKFGGLRYYANSREISTEGDWLNDPFRVLIREAERKSYRTCERCGKPGLLREGSWLRTLCHQHSEGREAVSEDFRTAIGADSNDDD